MATIRVKRNYTGGPGSTLLPGELAVYLGKLYFGPKMDVGEVGVSPIQLAGDDINNNFTEVNTFRMNSDNDFQIRTSGDAMATYGKTDGWLYSTANDNELSAAASGILVTRGYVDAKSQGLQIKDSVHCATTVNIDLSGTETIDGESVGVGGERVLVKNQTATEDNGIYIANSGGAWTRATDLDSSAEAENAFTFVNYGTTQEDTSWVTSFSDGDTIGTSPMLWAQFSAAGTYVADESSLTRIGNEFSIKSDWVGQTSITTLGTITTGVWSGTAILDAKISSASTWNGKQNALTFGILSGNSVIFSELVVNGEFPQVTATGLKSLDSGELKTALSLNNVDNVSINSWAGSANITTLGAIGTGTWNADAIGATYGGTGFSVYAVGDILYADGTTTLTKLTAGGTGKVLKIAGGVPTWGDDNDTTYSVATSTALGLVKLGSDAEQTVAANAVSSTASKSYAIQLNGANQMVVNVPWTDDDTTYSLISEAEIRNSGSATARLISGSRFYEGLAKTGETLGTTVDLGIGVTASSYTKTLNIGSGGASGSTTNINIGTGSTTVDIDLGGIASFTAAKAAGHFYTAASAPTNTDRLNFDGWLYATQFEGTIDGGTSWT